MSFDVLQDKIKAKKNPTVAGLDARVEYVPPHILKKPLLIRVKEDQVGVPVRCQRALVQPQQGGGGGGHEVQHICHISTAKGVDIVRQAKARGVRVTCETCPQYFTLTEDEILRQGTMARVIAVIQQGEVQPLCLQHGPPEQGKVLDGHPVVGEGGDLLIQDGKILRLGRDLAAPDAQILNADGLTAAPGSSSATAGRPGRPSFRDTAPSLTA